MHSISIPIFIKYSSNNSFARIINYTLKIISIYIIVTTISITNIHWFNIIVWIGIIFSSIFTFIFIRL